jgi:tetratricopeptide (TPR) repeat protein
MKIKILPFITFCILSIVQVSAQNFDTERKFIEMEQWSKALQFIESMKNESISDAFIDFYRGEAYFGLSKFDSAELSYTRGILVNPKQAFNFAGLGKIYLHQGVEVKAKEYFGKAIKNDKRNSDLYAYIGNECVEEKKPSLAEFYITKGMGRSKKNPDLHIAEAKLWLLKNEAGKAADSYERALIIDNNNERAYVELGKIYLKGENTEVAVTNLKKALEIDSLYIPALKELGNIYYWQNDYAAASSLYKKYMRIADISNDDKYRFAYILFYNKEYKESSQIIDSLITMDPKNTVLLRLKAYLSYALGVDNNDKVINKKYISSGLDAMNQFFALEQYKNKYLLSDYEYLAKLQKKCECGLDERAAENYLKAFQLDTTKYKFIEEAATIYTKANKPAKAILCYEKLIRIKPDEAFNYFKLGMLYYKILKEDTASSDSLNRKKALINADSAFQKVAVLTPKLPLGEIMRARTNAFLDPALEKGIAKPYYEKTLQIILDDTTNLAKNKEDLIECYQYLGYYYFVKAQNIKKKNPVEFQEAKRNSATYWTKLLDIRSNDNKANEMIKLIDKLSASK